MHTDKKKLVPRISIYCINQLLRGQKIIYKMVNLDKYVEDKYCEATTFKWNKFH